MTEIDPGPVIDTGSMVRIVRQSTTTCRDVPMVGKVGFVGEIQDRDGEVVLEFTELGVDGNSLGFGWVPAWCVELLDPASDAKWFAARQRYDAYLEQTLQEHRERQRRIEEARERAVASVCAVLPTTPPDRVRQIIAAFEREHRQIRREMGLD